MWIPAGLIPVLSTPFADDESIDLASLDKLTSRNTSARVDGVMYGGFASEFYKLDPGERRDAEVTVIAAASASSMPVVISVADHSTLLAETHVRSAVSDGATAINVLPPFFLGPSVSQVFSHVSACIGAAAPHPVMVQIAPALTGGGLGVAQIEALAARHENFAAVKSEAVPPGPMITSIRTALGDRLSTLGGYAGVQLIDSLSRGANGVQPGSSFPEIYRAILDAWAAGEEVSARRLHASLSPYLAYWMQDVELLIQVDKVIAKSRRWITSDACRRPGRSLDEFERRTVERFVAEFSPWLPGD